MNIYIAPQDGYILEQKKVFLIDVYGTIVAAQDNSRITNDYSLRLRDGVTQFLSYWEKRGKILAIQSDTAGLTFFEEFRLGDFANYHFLGEPPLIFKDEYGKTIVYEPFETSLSDRLTKDIVNPDGSTGTTYCCVKNFPSMVDEIAEKERIKFKLADAIVLGDAKYASNGHIPGENDELRGDTLSAVLTGVDILGIPPPGYPSEPDGFSFRSLIR